MSAEPLTINLNSTMRMMHPDPSFDGVQIEPAFEDYMYMMFDVCDAVEIKCLIYPMMGEINNAVAIVFPDGSPVIVYDRRLNEIIGGDGANALIAHELGHHYCGHLTFRASTKPHDAEAEADRFMGFAMAKLGSKLSELIATYEDLGIDKASASHPPMSRRALEITKGFYSSSLNEVCPGREMK